MESTTYDDDQGFAPTLPGSKPGGISLDRPKPTRGQKREANRLKQLKAQTQEIAATSRVPEMLRGELAENQSAPGVPQVTGLQTVQESRQLRSQEVDNQRGLGTLGTGRPSEYTDGEADAICAWVAAGGSLRSYCREHHRSMVTVYRWMRETTDFQTRYAQAHEDRADTLTDEMLDIADAASVDASIEGVAAAKLRVEARKWIASKLKPQRWGDKQVIEHKGAVSIRIGLTAKPQLPPVDIVDA